MPAIQISWSEPKTDSSFGESKAFTAIQRNWYWEKKKKNSLSQTQNWMKLLILKFSLEGQRNCIAEENKPLFSAFLEEFSTFST